MKKAVVLVLTLSLFFGYACAARAEAAPRKLTLMIYLCGSNLESEYGSASLDMEEMKKTDVDFSQVNVLVMQGGSSHWGGNKSAANADSTVIRQLGKAPRGGNTDFRPLTNSMKMNMGDPETLTYFLRFGMEKYPAEDYALILWDHGGGPMGGVCWDEVFSKDNLSLNELAAALNDAQLPKKLSWIGFDACLMSSVEVASMMAPFAEYMIASQAEEPGSGWNYAFLKDIENDENGGETGKRIVEAYFDAPQKANPDLTLACIDLSRIAEVEASMDSMYQGMSSLLSVETFSAIAKLRQTATGFGKSVDHQRSSGGYDLVDVVSLSECYAAENPEGAERVRQAVKEAVIHSEANIKDCNGLSVYHPFRNQNDFLSEWGEKYRSLDFCPGYTAYVGAYGQIMTGERFVRWNNMDHIDVLEEKNGGTIVLNISEDQAANLANARLVVLAQNIYDSIDEAYFQVYSTADVSVDGTTLSAVYNGTCMQVLNETGYDVLTGSISYRLTEDGTYLIDLYPIDENMNRAESPIIAEYTRDQSGRLLFKGYAVYDEMTGTYNHRVDINWSQYTGITFQNDYRIPTANAAGEYLAFDNWTRDEHTKMQWKARCDIDRTSFMVSMAHEMDFAEKLFAAYEITDTQGNVYMTKLAPLNGGVASYPCETSVWTLPPKIDGSLYVLKQSALQKLPLDQPDYTVLALHVYNGSASEQTCQIDGVTINGISVPDSVFGLYDDENDEVKFLSQYGEDVIEMPFEQTMLAELLSGEPIREISCIMTLFMVNGDEIVDYSYQLSIEPDQPVPVVSAKTQLNESLEKYDCAIRSEEHLRRDVPDLTAVIADEGKADQIRFFMIVDNLGNEAQTCLVTELMINGVSFPDAIGGRVDDGNNLSFASGEMGLMAVRFNKYDLKEMLGDESIHSITGTLDIDSKGQNSYSYEIQFAAEPDTPVPISHSENGDTLYYDCTLKLPMLGNEVMDISSFAIRKPSDYALNSRLIVNFIMTNTSDKPIHYLIDNLNLNGIPVGKGALNYPGSGPVDLIGRNSIAPGEQSGASVDLRYEQISAIFPEVYLRDISFDLTVYQIDEENDEIQANIPVQLVCNVPLNDFYLDAAELPPQFLIDYGKQIGAINDKSAREIFAYEGCAVSLEGVYIVNRSFELLLHCENQSDTARKIYLGQAEMDGLPAVIGQSTNSYVAGRNRRVKTFGVDAQEWPKEYGAEVSLAPGEAQYCYVSMLPSSEEQTECRQISFQAYMYCPDNVWDCAYFDKITLSTEEPAPLQEGFCAVAPAEDYLITGGQILPSTDDVSLFSDTIEIVGAADRQPVLLEMTSLEDETMEVCHYALFTKVRSEAELAGLNILNTVDDAVGDAVVSFAQGREWLIFDFFGELEISGDGHTAAAVYPGLRAMVYAGGESFPLRNTRIELNDDGTVVFWHLNDRFFFSTTVFPSALLSYGVKGIKMAYDPDTDAGTLITLEKTVNVNGYESKYSSLAGLLQRKVHMIPADSEPKEIAMYLYGELPLYNLYQMQYMYGEPLRLAIEPVSNMEDYYVSFFYVTADGSVNATPLQSLSDFCITTE